MKPFRKARRRVARRPYGPVAKLLVSMGWSLRGSLRKSGAWTLSKRYGRGEACAVRLEGGEYMVFVCGFASVFAPMSMFEKRSASSDEECCLVLSEMMASCFGSLPEFRLMAAVGLGAVAFEDAVKAMEDRDAGGGA